MKIKTIFNPGVAMCYVIKHLYTGKKIKASTCGVHDVQYMPWRSPKGSEAGKEFFKMKVGGKKEGVSIITFLNSNTQEKCLSTCGEWEFTGERPDGTFIEKLSNKIKKPYKKPVVNVMKTYTQIVEIKKNDIIENTKIETENESFVNDEELNHILN